MKALMIADSPPLELPDGYRDADLVVCAGDLAPGLWSDQVARLDCPKIGIYGNHCLPGYLPRIGIREAHARILTLSVGGAAFRVLGFDGCKRYKAYVPFQFDEEEMEPLVQAVDPAGIDLVVTHAPPFGINDSVEGCSINQRAGLRACAVGPELEHLPDVVEETHAGFKAFWPILRAQPTYWLHGHTYPERHGLPPDRMVCSTAFHYTNGARMVDLGSTTPDPYRVSAPVIRRAEAQAVATLAPPQRWWHRLFG